CRYLMPGGRRSGQPWRPPLLAPLMECFPARKRGTVAWGFSHWMPSARARSSSERGMRHSLRSLTAFKWPPLHHRVTASDETPRASATSLQVMRLGAGVVDHGGLVITY